MLSLQLQAFRMQQESREGLRFLWADGKVEDAPRELVNIQASHAEAVLELQKTRNLLLLDCIICLIKMTNNYRRTNLQMILLDKLILNDTLNSLKMFLCFPPGDYVLRDPAGGPRGMVRVLIKWKYPFQPPGDDLLGRQGRQDRPTESTEREERSRKEAEVSQRPIAKPRVKVIFNSGFNFELSQPNLKWNKSSSCVFFHYTASAGDSEGDKLRVEILSLTFEPSSHVALDESVQRVYVEYRLLGIPMETTETPMSLRKPTEGEEVHYNFTRVIYVDSSRSAPLRQYLYTMLEGTDPNQGRLKFTVVSEPMDDDEECVDVGHAFLDLQELLLTGNDVIEQQIDSSMDEDKEVIGNLKVSLEAAKALTGIYQEFHQKTEIKKEDKTDEEEEEEEEEKEEEDQGEEKKKEVIDYDDDSDFY
uniref:Protein fantom-like n=1 Tax=Seriola dumerili TaxID=41447 RepID=A0A3B4VK57_SERDU